MKRAYAFERREADGVDTVVAEPVSGAAEPVELASTWGTEGDVEGEFERVVHAVLDAELFESFQVGAGVARVERSTAAEAVVERIEGVRDERQADALVAFLAASGVWTLDDEDVVVLKDPRDASLSGREALSWAAALDVCVARIDEFVDELDTRANRVQTLDAERDRFEARVHAVTSEMRALGRGSKFPEDPSALGGAERERYVALRTLLDDVVRSEADSNELRVARNVLTSARDAFATRESEVRVHAIQRNAFPDDANSIASRLEHVVVALASEDGLDASRSLEDVVTAVASVGTVDEAVEEMDGDDLAKMVENEIPDLDMEDDVAELAEMDVEPSQEETEEGENRVD